MCAECGWRVLIDAIEAHLDRRPLDHGGLILAKASDVIEGNQCVSKDLRETVEQVIEERDARLG